MTEPTKLPSWNDLDELVDTNPLELRNEAWRMRSEVECLQDELEANRQRWYHNDQSRTECVAGFALETRECVEGGGTSHVWADYLATALPDKDERAARWTAVRDRLASRRARISRCPVGTTRRAPAPVGETAAASPLSS
ncbi:hypothetical protein ABZ897_60305 [Nonomuraea sp. NPDC046802]|uniref:hypothetical protein n=1 Tax=Nonomuraea sp. NPDC046802 TaxID=3154919 RepID=UPI0033FDDCA9